MPGIGRQSLPVSASQPRRCGFTGPRLSPRRFGPRRIILPCILVFSTAYASLALLTPHLLHFYLGFLVIGLVGNGIAYLGYSRAISTWFDRRRGLALSIMLAGGGCGAMLFPVIAQAAITQYGWRMTYALLGTLALALVWVCR